MLLRPDGEPSDPAVLLTPIPNWEVGEVIAQWEGERLRVVAIPPDTSDELVAKGFSGVLVVEPA